MVTVYSGTASGQALLDDPSAIAAGGPGFGDAAGRGSRKMLIHRWYRTLRPSQSAGAPNRHGERGWSFLIAKKRWMSLYGKSESEFEMKSQSNIEVQ